jgi:PKHD-type hydroxylase
MLVQIPQVLNQKQVQLMRQRLGESDSWVDGRVTAGHQGVAVKRNQQIAEGSLIANELGNLILEALESNPLFISTALPNNVYPPMFNRYGESMQFGSHVDGAIRLIPGTGIKFRTDISATLFLSDPHEYDGGELLIEDAYGMRAVKMYAGDMIVYPATSLHQVKPITRGERVASFFWIQSLIRDDSQRTLLYDLDRSIQHLTATNADEAARIQLTGCYHNLLRMWSEL